jgi:hypothetical protein
MTTDNPTPEGLREYYGHGTRADGTHVRFTSEEAKALWDSIEQNRARKAEAMPTTEDAIRTMFDGFDRLRDFGWRGGPYCPKDGTPFAAICHGSTGIFTGSYVGEWPSGSAMIEDCFTHPDGFIWKPLNQLTEWEEAQRQKALKDGEAYRERMFQVFAEMDEHEEQSND